MTKNKYLEIHRNPSLSVYHNSSTKFLLLLLVLCSTPALRIPVPSNRWDLGDDAEHGQLAGDADELDQTLVPCSGSKAAKRILGRRWVFLVQEKAKIVLWGCMRRDSYKSM